MFKKLMIVRNPTSDIIQIETQHTMESITLYDQTGRIIANLKALKNNVVQLNMASLVSGICYYQVNANGHVANGKIIKQ